MKKNKPFGELFYRSLKKTLLIMRIAVILLILGILQARANDAYSQKTRLSLNFSETELVKVLDKIEVESEFFFLYNEKLLDIERKVDITVKDQLISTILDDLFAGTDVKYTIIDRKIILAPEYLSEVSNIQQKQITGTVTDKNGTPLPGVNVVVTGSTTGTITDLNGKYALTILPDAQSLTFTFIGMEPKQISIGTQTQIDVTMTESSIGLDEVVVVGYGTSRKKDLTGSVANVDMEERAPLITVSPVQALRGSIAGVSVTDNGKLGSDGTILIRGQASISANNAPLLVLDGVPFSGALSDISSNDIESIDILKDASSAAIYGSRAANGVIIITTKRGKSSKPLISYNTYYGHSYYGHKPNYQNGEQYIQKILDWRAADGLSSDPADIVNYLYPMEVEHYTNGITIDPYKEISQDAPMLNHTLSFSQGLDKVKYYISGSYTDQKGVLLNDKYKNYSFRINVESTINNWMRIGINTSYSNRDYSGKEPDLNQCSMLSPYSNYYRDETKSKIYFLPMNEGFIWNPMINFLYTDNLDLKQNFFINVFTNITLPYGFSFNTNYSSTSMWSKEFEYNKSYNQPDEGVSRLGDGSRTIGESSNWIFDNILKWDRSIKDIHTFNLTLLYSCEHSESYKSILSSNNIWSDVLGFNGLQIGENPTIGTSAGEDNTISSMIRLFYRYKDKYLLTLTTRRDGYSTFGSGHKFGIFPSVALGWNISEENFLNNISWINYLKVRYSIGKNGNQAIGRYASLSQMTTTYYVFGDNGSPTVGLYNSSMENPDLSWESTWASNLGLDFSFLNNRISGVLEYYDMKTEDLLLKRTLPTMNGFNSVWQNIGATRNKGFEATLNTINIEKSNFSWQSTFAFATNKNKITKLVGDVNNDGKEDDIIASGWFIGYPINTNYDYEWDGIYQVGETMPAWAKPGYPKIIDKNENGYIDAGDRSVLHADEPDFRLSVSNIFKWKKFTLNFLVNSQKGGYRASPLFNTGTSLYQKSNNLDIPYWTPENKSNEWQIVNFLNPWGQKFYRSRSFARLQDVSLSYDFSESVLRKINFANLRIYLSGKNLITITDWPLWDPEIGDTDRGSYGPMYRSFIIGINVTL